MKRSNALGALSALALPIGISEIAFGDEKSAASAAEVSGVVGREVDAYNAHDGATVTKLHAPGFYAAAFRKGSRERIRPTLGFLQEELYGQPQRETHAGKAVRVEECCGQPLHGR